MIGPAGTSGYKCDLCRDRPATRDRGVSVQVGSRKVRYLCAVCLSRVPRTKPKRTRSSKKVLTR